MPRLARSRHGVEAPFAHAGRGVVSVNESAHSVLAAGNADHHQILHRQRSDRKAVSLLIFGGHNVPDHIPRLRIERNHVSIERPQKNFVP